MASTQVCREGSTLLNSKELSAENGQKSFMKATGDHEHWESMEGGEVGAKVKRSSSINASDDSQVSAGEAPGFFPAGFADGVDPSVRDVLLSEVDNELARGRFGPLIQFQAGDEVHKLEELKGSDKVYGVTSAPIAFEDETGKICWSYNTLINIYSKDCSRITQEALQTERTFSEGLLETVNLRNIKHCRKSGLDVVCWARQEYRHIIPETKVHDGTLDVQATFNRLLNPGIFDQKEQRVVNYMDAKGRKVKEIVHYKTNGSTDAEGWTSWKVKDISDPENGSRVQMNKQRSHRCLGRHRRFAHDSWHHVVKTVTPMQSRNAADEPSVCTYVTVLVMHRFTPYHDQQQAHSEDESTWCLMADTTRHDKQVTAAAVGEDCSEFRVERRRILEKLKRVSAKLSFLRGTAASSAAYAPSNNSSEDGDTSQESITGIVSSECEDVLLSESSAHVMSEDDCIMRGAGGGDSDCQHDETESETAECYQPISEPPSQPSLEPLSYPSEDPCSEMPPKYEPCCDITAHCTPPREPPCASHELDPLFEDLSKIPHPTCAEMARIERHNINKELRGRWGDKVLKVKVGHLYLSLPTFDPLGAVHSQLAQAKIAAMAIRYNSKLSQVEQEFRSGVTCCPGWRDERRRRGRADVDLKKLFLKCQPRVEL